MNNSIRAIAAALASMTLSAGLANAKVPEEEVAKLGVDLHPFGAEKAGNADGQQMLFAIWEPPVTIAASVLPRPAGTQGTAPASKMRPARTDKDQRLQANRWAKRTMLGSLAVSMALALQGAKRGHALTGLVFLHALGLHLWVHRRTILK